MSLIYLVAGEQSGDVLGLRLMTALQARRPGLRFAGIGGTQMAKAGLVSLFRIEDLAVMGLLEVVPRLAVLRRRLAETVADVRARQPDVLVTIDSPGFSLRLLRAVAPFGIRRAHYVAPQAWAWRAGRVRRWSGLWDRLLCLLPFEPGFFATHNLTATFVGHPVLESGADRGDAARFRAVHVLPPNVSLVTIMPGSRPAEVARLLPVLGATLQRLPASAVVPVLPVAPPVTGLVAAGTRDWPVRPLLVTEAADKHDAFAASAAALTKSGTSTLELALAGVPMVVAYRVNALSAAIARRLITVRHAALINLLADPAHWPGSSPSPCRRGPAGGVAKPSLVPELLQEHCTPERLAAELQALLQDPHVAAAQWAGFRAVIETLKAPVGLPSAAAAAAVLDLLDQP